MTTEISINNLTKSYGNIKALNCVSFDVNAGELFGLIGPDGSGRTTCFRLMATLLLPDSGSGTIHGYDMVKDYRKIRSIVGYMPGKFSLYGDLTVEENLNFYASVFRTSIKENYHLIREIYGMLEPFKNRLASKLSGGMKQKLALCCALIHNPKILFLDEPTTGVDPISRKEFWEMLNKLRRNGITIVVSTPYMDEAMKCDKIAILDNGNILKIAPPNSFIEDFKRDVWSLEGDNNYHLLIDSRKSPQVDKCYPFGDSIHLIFKNNNPDIEKFLSELNALGHNNSTIKKIPTTIEDVYMNLPKNGQSR